MSDPRSHTYVFALTLWEWCDEMTSELDAKAETPEGKDSLVSLITLIRREVVHRVIDLIYTNEEPLGDIISRHGLDAFEEPE